MESVENYGLPEKVVILKYRPHVILELFSVKHTIECSIMNEYVFFFFFFSTHFDFKPNELTCSSVRRRNRFFFPKRPDRSYTQFVRIARHGPGDSAVSETNSLTFA